MSNLPDDWGRYRRVCETCGHSYHLSGTEECKCEPCKTENCWTLATTEDGHCRDCAMAEDEEECPACEYGYPSDEMGHNDQDEPRCFDCLSQEAKEKKQRYRVVCFVHVPCDPAEFEPMTMDEAKAELKHQTMLQPENRYEIQPIEEGGE
jgi:hypothetical protein